jgi:lipoprotein NlpD
VVYCKPACLVVVALLSGCVQQGQPLVTDKSPDFSDPNPSVVPPVAKRPSTRPKAQSRIPVERARAALRAPSQYRVRKGDTLISIAWRFELDHRELGRLNTIRPPFTIFPGQILQLKPRAAQGRQSNPGVTATAPRPSPTQSSPLQKKSKSTKPVAKVLSTKWAWPVAIKAQREFSRTNKGMDYLMTAKHRQIKAASTGSVVYAGNGIGGYEQLIIIRHQEDLLSAYSFNGQTVVKEQDRVKAGQKVADISITGRGSQKLHFELRKNGSPINPRTIIR